MRVVCLVPAVTEWFRAFGALGSIVGRCHEAAGAIEADEIPVVSSADASQIIHADILRSLDPDVVIASRFHGSCAVSGGDAEATLEESTGRSEICYFDPLTFKQVLDAILYVARASGILNEAMTYLAKQEEALSRAQRAAGIGRRHYREADSRVLCLERIEPPVVPGRWLPDLLELAGEEAVLADSGGPTTEVDWPQVAKAKPDQVVVLTNGIRDDVVVATVRRELASRHHDAPIHTLPASQFADPGPGLYGAAVSLIQVLRYPALEQFSARS